MEERLLSDDLITEAILTYYFHIVRMVNIVDSDMQYYESIINNVRTYLVRRPDILKAIIACWKDCGQSPAPSNDTFKVLDLANYHGLESDDDEEEADKWDV